MGMILMKCVLDKEYKNELSGKARFYLVFYFISTTFLFGFNAFTFAAHMCGMIAGMVTEFILQKIRDRRQKLEVV